MKAVQYLQNLGAANWGVICDFSPWVMEVSERDGLTIFTEDLPEVEALPRDEVMSFLIERRPSAVIPYLKHVVHSWREENPVFHTSLALHYKEYIMELIASGKETPKELAGGRVYNATVQEARRELRKLLMSPASKHDPTLLEGNFPVDSLEEERAILLGSLGRHLEALVLLLYRLKDIPAAIAHCKRFDGDAGDREDQGVYSLAFKLLLRPPDVKVLRALNLPTNSAPPGNIDHALELLSSPSCKVDLGTALSCLPDDVAVEKIEPFLRKRMEERLSRRNHERLVRGLMHAEHLQVTSKVFATIFIIHVM